MGDTNMGQNRYIISGVLGLVFILASGFMQKRSDSRSQWRELLVSEAGFSVLFPHNSDSPEYFDGEVRTGGHPGTIPAHTYGGKDGDVKYAVVYSVLRDKIGDSLLLDIRKTLISKQARGRILSQRRLSLGGYSGMEYTAGSKQEDEVVYLLRVLPPKDKLLRKYAYRFFDSFKLIGS